MESLSAAWTCGRDRLPSCPIPAVSRSNSSVPFKTAPTRSAFSHRMSPRHRLTVAAQAGCAPHGGNTPQPSHGQSSQARQHGIRSPPLTAPNGFPLHSLRPDTLSCPGKLSGPSLRPRKTTSPQDAFVPRAQQDGAEGETSSQQGRGKQWEIGLAAGTTIALGVTNRVLYKMALVPLSKYPFFLAQLTTFGYVIVYFLFLGARYRAGIVTEDMLQVPKGKFLAMGILEALGLATGMAAATVLPGTMITVLGQSFLIWQLTLSAVILKRRYTPGQLVGCLFVMAGVIAAIVNSGSLPSAAALGSTGLGWPALFTLSTAFPACSSIIKEGVFADARKRTGKPLDIFVVNSFGSAFQALFVFLLLPLLSRIGLRIPFSELPAYFQDGAGCMLNLGKDTSCEGAPLLPLLYIAGNLAFNISLLELLKKSSAVVTSLAISVAVPLTIAAFTLPLPFLGSPQQLGWGFFGGAALLVLGLFIFNLSGQPQKPTEEAKKED